MAAHVDLEAVTVQERWVEWPDVVYAKVGNIQRSRIMGGDVRMDPAGFDSGRRDSWQRALASVEEAGGTPYPIPAGASDHALRLARLRELGPGAWERRRTSSA